jgi:hypothetical protein
MKKLAACLGEAGQLRKLELPFSFFFDGTRNHKDEDRPSRAHSHGLRKGMRTKWIPALLLAWGLLALAGCKQKEPVPAFFETTVTPMDYLPTDTFVRDAYVDGRWVGAAGDGASMVANGITLPTKWHPGLTVRVKWQRCDRRVRGGPQTEEELCKWHELDVPVHEYTTVGHTWLHILDDEHVLVIPSMLAPGHPDYPGPDVPKKNFIMKRGIGE